MCRDHILLKNPHISFLFFSSVRTFQSILQLVLVVDTATQDRSVRSRRPPSVVSRSSGGSRRAALIRLPSLDQLKQLLAKGGQANPRVLFRHFFWVHHRTGRGVWGFRLGRREVFRSSFHGGLSRRSAVGSRGRSDLWSELSSPILWVLVFLFFHREDPVGPVGCVSLFFCSKLLGNR